MGAVLVVVLVVMWVVYAIPHIAVRRDVMGQSHRRSRERAMTAPRDLTDRIHAPRQSIPHHETRMAMTDPVLRARPGDPTSRPRLLGVTTGVERTVAAGEVSELAVAPAEITSTNSHQSDAGAAISEGRGVSIKGPVTRPRFTAMRRRAARKDTDRAAEKAATESRTRPASSKARLRKIRGVVLLGLCALVILSLILALTGVVSWWTPVLSFVVTAIYVVQLRRVAVAEQASSAQRTRERGARVSHATRRLFPPSRSGLQARVAAMASTGHDAGVPVLSEAVPETKAEIESEDLDQDLDDLDVVRTPRSVLPDDEWTPIPTPAPRYLLQGEVDDLEARHQDYLRAIQAHDVHARLQERRTLRASLPWECEDVEEQEAADEAAPLRGARNSAGSANAGDSRALTSADPQVSSVAAALDLDGVLARRRA